MTLKWACPKCGSLVPETKAVCDCGEPQGNKTLLSVGSGDAPPTALAIVPKETPTMMEPVVQAKAVSPPVPALDLTASTPTGMRHAQQDLIDWMGNKLASVQQELEQSKAEAAELHEAFEHAQKRKWQTSTISKHHNLALKRVSMAEQRIAYYTKIMQALQAGFYIVPPMGMTLFAIRTDAKKPAKKWRCLTWKGEANFKQEAKTLPAGEGEYKNPQPEIRENHGEEYKDSEGQVKRPYWAHAWEPIDFPVTMLKPHIMKATDRAMALKIFDELGVLPQDYRRNPDPVILGRIYEPKKGGYYEPKAITFLIVWHLNTKDL